MQWYALLLALERMFCENAWREHINPNEVIEQFHEPG
jgi:hypothetical protein